MVCKQKYLLLLFVVTGLGLCKSIESVDFSLDLLDQRSGQSLSFTMMALYRNISTVATKADHG